MLMLSASMDFERVARFHCTSKLAAVHDRPSGHVSTRKNLELNGGRRMDSYCAGLVVNRYGRGAFSALPLGRGRCGA